MLKINDLPNIALDNIGEDVDQLIKNNKLQFRALIQAPKLLKLISEVFCEPYIAYKDTIYVPLGHIEAAQSKEPGQRIIATSKLLPWAFAIKNGSLSSWWSLLYTITNSTIRNYYFLYEFSLLKAHELPADTSELVAIGFVSTRRNIFLFKKNPDKLLRNMKTLIHTKIELSKPSQ